MKESEDDLSPPEVEMLRELKKEKTPPDFLEHRIVQALKDDQLIRTSSSRFLVQRPLMIGSALAASVALLVLGFTIGAWWRSTSAPTQPLPEFILVLRNSPREVPIRSADDELQRVREYGAWARKLGQEGVVLDGEKLKDEARIMNQIDGQTVVSDMAAEASKTAMAGYFLIRARDYQQAERIAQNCPHVKYGGTIEIRQIDAIAQQPN